MTVGREVHYTYAEYLALEASSSVRHEYWRGEIYAMAGGTPDRAALAAALIGALHGRVPPTFRVFSSDLRVVVEATDLTTYPDVSVVCGKSARSSKDPIAVTNPVFIAEITSPWTEDYDRGEKLRSYQTIPGVREILLVSHRGPRVTVHRRTADGFAVFEVERGELVLESVGVTIDVDALYAGGLEDA